MRKFTPLAILTVLLCGYVSIAFAQTTTGMEDAQVPPDFLKHVTPRTARPGEIEAKRSLKFAGNGPASAASTSGLPGIDSIVNFSDQFMTPGFDNNGNPQSVWPYTMVGAPPESNQSTTFNAPIIPVTVDLLDASGKVRIVNGHPLTLAATPAIVGAVVNSPVYQPFIYNSGIGQFNDQLMRTQFWDRIRHHVGDNDADDGYHNNLRPDVDTPRRMQIPFGFYQFGLDTNGNPAFFLIDFNTFANLLFPAFGVPVDNSTPVGAAELAGDIKTRDISTFLFNNVYLYDTVPSNCCVLGFHTIDVEPGDKRNGNRDRLFVLNYSSWITNGFFGEFKDITAFSHEMSETFADPFVNNATPWWLSFDPVTGAALCQNNLENGDVIEVLSSNPVFSIAMNGRTYHPQNVATFSWFAFQSPSHALNGAYSFPDETTLTTLSPANLKPNCVP